MKQHKKLVLLLMVFVATPLFALSLPPSFDQVVDAVLKQDYEYGKLLVTECTTCTTEDSLFYSLLIENGAMVDYESYALGGESFSKKVDAVVPLLLEKVTSQPRYAYYAATLMGASGVAKVKTGEIMSGASVSRQSVNILRDIVQKEPAFKPAYLGIGLYSYYLSTSLSWIPFVSRGRNDGISLVERSASFNHISSYSALQSLFWVYLDEERYDAAENCAKKFLQVYPDNTLMLRGLVALYMRTGIYDKAHTLATKLQEQAEQRIPINWADFFSAGRSRAEALRNLGEENKTKLLVDSLLSVEVPVEVLEIEWVRRHVKSLRKIKKELE